MNIIWGYVEFYVSQFHISYSRTQNKDAADYLQNLVQKLIAFSTILRPPCSAGGPQNFSKGAFRANIY